jgi:beta-1,4-N-acetylglucosaminyltransferase
MRVFVTVGTTKFASLVSEVLSPEIQTQLLELGFTSMTIQTGQTTLDSNAVKDCKLDVSFYDYKPSLAEDILSASLVISHAGAGTCLEVLGAGTSLIVIVNDQLMDNHQLELADRLASDCVLVCGDVTSLGETLHHWDRERHNLAPYTPGDGAIFSKFIDQLMQV